MSTLATFPTVASEPKGKRVLDSFEYALTLGLLLVSIIRIGYESGRDEMRRELIRDGG